MSGLPAISPVKDRHRKRSAPAWKHRLSELSELRLLTRLFPVVGKYRLIPRQKTPHQDQIPIIIQAYAHHLQSLRRVLLRQFIQQRVFVTARFAPRRPKVHQQRFPVVLLDQFLVTLQVDHFWIAGARGLRGLRRSQGRRCGQQAKLDKASPYSHGPSFYSILSAPPPVEK